MNYKKYQNARNASWELLIHLKINELPIKISTVIRSLEIPLYAYGDNQDSIKENEFEKTSTESDGFTVYKNGKYHIFYNENQTSERIRFTLAHELGHIMCNHLSEKNPITKRNKEPSANDSTEEQEANIFASRLLAPACVLHELKLFTAKEIAEFCKISETSANFRLERLLLLEQRNTDFLKTKGYGCFYLSSLEKQVFNQFKSYIEKSKL